MKNSERLNLYRSVNRSRIYRLYESFSEPSQSATISSRLSKTSLKYGGKFRRVREANETWNSANFFPH